jgi:LCP family protein required for cell wall assembly
MGVAGGEHEGKDLTDTMIFTSIDLGSGDVVMLSIPRDIWLDSLQAKVNTAYHYGQKKSAGGGFVLAKDAVYQITGQSIHYVVVLDFSGFVKAVNLVGGVDVEVERSFTDEQYPIPGKETDECGGDSQLRCRYETIRFEKGLQHLDGETALKFVRSRNAQGEEGTDFARSNRQQKVIVAFKNKLLSSSTLLAPGKLLALKQTFSQNVTFDKELSEEELGGFASLFWRFVRGRNSLRTLTLDTGTEENPGFLINPPIKQYGQWVLVPRAGDWSQFQEFLSQKLGSQI